MYPYLGPGARRAARGHIEAAKPNEITTMLNAGGRHLPHAGWTELAHGPAHVRTGVACAITCPADIHDKLLSDNTPSVKTAAQTHTPLSKMSLAEAELELARATKALTKSERGTARGVAEHILETNPNPSREALAGIVTHVGLEELAARYDVSERIEDIAPYVDTHRARDVHAIASALAKYPRTTKTAWANGVEVERVFAAATLTSPAQLRALAKDPSSHVREQAGLNPHANIAAVAAWLTRTPTLAEDLTRWTSAGGDVEELAQHATETANTTLAQALVRTTAYTTHPPVTATPSAKQLIDMLAERGEHIMWSTVTSATNDQLLTALQAARDKSACAVEIADHEGASWEVICAASAHMRVFPTTIQNMPQAHMEHLAMSTVAELAFKAGDTRMCRILAEKVRGAAEEHTWTVVQHQVEATWAAQLTLQHFAQVLPAVLAHPDTT